MATTTLMQIIAGSMAPDSGTVTWGQTTSRTYLPKDINEEYAGSELPIIDWLRQFASKEESDNTFCEVSWVKCCSLVAMLNDQ